MPLTIPNGLATLARGRDALSTNEAAHVLNRRLKHCGNGHAWKTAPSGLCASMDASHGRSKTSPCCLNKPDRKRAGQEQTAQYGVQRASPSWAPPSPVGKSASIAFLTMPRLRRWNCLPANLR